ncbi:MAG TPA: hypothetical protein QF753_08815 [Victivallales bacterium]|nr:hypothetical protein [Victivallales bacterium]
MRKYHHLGIPTEEKREDELYLPNLKLCIVSSYAKSQYGIELIRFDKDSTAPELIKTSPHIAFEVDDIEEEINGKNIILEPYSPSNGITVAFIEENDVAIEFLQYS